MTKPTKSSRKRDRNQIGLRLMRKSYYHRYNLNGKDNLIPLKTSDLKIAIDRNIEVLKNIDDIKSHKQIYLYWLEELMKTESDTTAEAIGEKFVKIIRRRGIRESTITIYEATLRYFICANDNIEIRTLSLDHIDSFIDYFKKRNENVTSAYINKNLRHLKAFLNWCADRNYLNSIPKIRLIRIPKSPPKYFNNVEYNSICNYLSSFQQRVVHLYRSTGMRLNEGLNGEIKGNYYVISAENYKTNRPHSIPINDDLKATLAEMQSKSHTGDYYSREFKKACVKAGIFDKHFHCLRHTMALRTYLKTRDIFYVKMLLGHSSITTTEKYADFDIVSLSSDFPDLIKDDNNSLRQSGKESTFQVNPYISIC
ncbi:MAG: site-specific integrase [Candidatus Marinimicrobia bacterium]|nr:site-specific integrase [Candidatus Neomarinimicrobiota bacterium]